MKLIATALFRQVFFLLQVNRVADKQTALKKKKKKTPFKLDSSGLSVENYCSDPTTPCTIKTRTCGFGAGIFISRGTESHIQTDKQTEMKKKKNTPNVFFNTCPVQTKKCSARDRVRAPLLQATACECVTNRQKHRKS